MKLLLCIILSIFILTVAAPAQTPPQIQTKLDTVKTIWYNQPDRALTIIDEILKSAPNTEKAYDYRALIYRGKGKWDIAAEQYGALIKINPNNPVYYFEKSFCREMLKQYKEAIAEMSSAIGLAPDSIRYLYKRCGLYYDDGQYGKSFDDFKKLQTMGIKDSDRKSLYVRYIQLPKSANQQANDFLKNGKDYKLKDTERIAYMVKAIQADPGLAEAYYEKGKLLKSANKPHEAIIDLSKAIELYPVYKSAYQYRADLYLEMKSYDKAIQDYDAALLFDPKDDYIYTGKQLAYLRQGKYDKALEITSDRIKNASSVEVVYRDRGDIYYEMKEFKKAIGEYTNFLSRLKSGAMADLSRKDGFYYRALCWLELKQYAPALRDLRQASALKDAQADSIITSKGDWSKMGWEKGKQSLDAKNYEAAIDYYTICIDEQYKIADAYYQRGCVFLQIPRPVEAESDFKKAQESGNPDAAQKLEELYTKFPDLKNQKTDPKERRSRRTKP